MTDILFNPPEPNGDNGWYVGNITITLDAIDDISGVNITYYSINSEPWEVYDKPFIFHDDRLYYIVYFSVDNAGNMEFPKVSHFKLDQTPPDIGKVEWRTYKISGGFWFCDFICTAVDNTSGMNRVEHFVNNGIQEIIKGIGPVYVFVMEVIHVTRFIHNFFHYDNAGNSVMDSVNGSNITSYPYTQNYNMFFLRLLDRFPLLQKILDVLKLNR